MTALGLFVIKAIESLPDSRSPLHTFLVAEMPDTGDGRKGILADGLRVLSVHHGREGVATGT